MGCTFAPLPPFPTLPPGITLGIPIPTPAFDATLCCKIIAFDPIVPPLPLPPFLATAAAAIITAQLALLEAYFDAIPFECPREAAAP